MAFSVKEYLTTTIKTRFYPLEIEGEAQENEKHITLYEKASDMPKDRLDKSIHLGQALVGRGIDRKTFSLSFGVMLLLLEEKEAETELTREEKLQELNIITSHGLQEAINLVASVPKNILDHYFPHATGLTKEQLFETMIENKDVDDIRYIMAQQTIY